MNLSEHERYTNVSYYELYMTIPKDWIWIYDVCFHYEKSFNPKRLILSSLNIPLKNLRLKAKK